MPEIRNFGIDAKNRVTRRGRRVDALVPYREAIANLEGDGVFEVTPSPGESMRRVKVSVSRAAKQINRQVKYGDTKEGTLLVWLEATARRRRRRRARPRFEESD